MAAAGNYGTTRKVYPGGLPGVLSVGATNAKGTARTGFSTYGSWVDLSAPGANILAAQSCGGHLPVSGTSFAAPLVAGGAALVLAANPHATGEDLAEALQRSHSGRVLGFARGTARFDRAIDLVTPVTQPTITAPREGETVTGDIVVSAASTARFVEFRYPGVRTRVPVANGVASTRLSTLGTNGVHYVSAHDCTALRCGTKRDIHVLVENPAPVLTTPAEADRIDTTAIAASAEASGGSVQFLVDGEDRLVPPVPGSAATAQIPTEHLTNSKHTIQALQCNAAGTVCDTVRASDRHTVDVERLRPWISAGSTTFSPNGDGRHDAFTRTYSLDAPTQEVFARVQDASGATVLQRGPIVATAGAGYSYTWDGRRSDGTVVPDGRYTIHIDTSDTSAATPLGGRATTYANVDTTRPVMTGTSSSVPTVYPVRDDYVDATALSTHVSEPVAGLRAEIRNAAGTLARRFDLGARTRAGTATVTWGGRNGSGTPVAPGSYTVRFVARDEAGNDATSAATTVRVSDKRLVRRTGSKVVRPVPSLFDWYTGRCGDVFRDVRDGWRDSLGYYSNVNCAGSGDDSVATGFHFARLPAAIRYGQVRVDAYGGSARRESVADLAYLDRYGEFSDRGRVLQPGTRRYTGPWAGADAHVDYGRYVTWLVATAEGNRYDVRDFRVVWTYYALA